MRQTLCISMVILSVLTATQVLALRCDDGLVDVGDLKAEVLARCGTPASKQLVAIEKTTNQAGETVLSEVPIEQWTYNFGPKSFLQILTFRDGTLTRIETGDRVSEATDSSGRLWASVGDTMDEVRQNNGEPYLIEFVGTETEPVTVADKDQQGLTRLEMPIDRWTYRFGAGKFMQILTFKGGRLVAIETGARE